jgi:pimeloyl-ACP methyl ester carboxylesterase
VSLLFLAEGVGVAALLVVLAKRGFFKSLKSSRGSNKIEEKVVPIGKGQISYLVGGKPGASTVLLLHGFAADKEHWRDLFPPLDQAGYQIVAPDLPGFGANFPDPDEKFDATSLAKSIRTFAKQAGLVSFHIVGHEIGGIVAASYAYAFPTEVASLTLIEPIGLTVPAESDFDRQLKNNRNPLLIAKPEAYDALVAYCTVTAPPMKSAKKRLRAENLANQRPFYQMVWSQLFEGERAKLLDILLPELKRRTLVVLGAKSKVVTAATGKMVEIRMADARVGTIPDAGHWLMLEKPKELADMLVSFFKGGGPAKAAARASQPGS